MTTLAVPAPLPAASACPAGGGDDCSHFVQFYESDAFLVESVTRFVSVALGVGDRVALFMTAQHRRAVEEALQKGNLDLAGAAARGDFMVFDARETLSHFMVGKEPDRNLFFQHIGGMMEKLGEGGKRIKAFGEMVALLCAEGNGEGAATLESLWNELGKVHSFSLFCAYPLNEFGGDAQADLFNRICGHHSHVLPSEDFTAMADAGDRLRSVAILQQRSKSLELERERRRVSENARMLLAAIVDSSDDAIISKSLKGVITSWNAAASRIFGYTAEETIGRHISMLFPPDRLSEEDRILEKLGRGERVDHFETVRITKSGRPVEVSLTISPIRDSSGALVGASKVARDITELKRSQHLLEERERFLRAIVDNTPDCIKIVARDGTLLEMNPAGLSMVGAQHVKEVRGKNIDELIVPEDRERFRSFNENVCRGEQGSLEFDIVGLGGVRRTMETFAVPLVNPDGQTVHLGLTRDITQRKRGETALLESRKELAGELAAVTGLHMVSSMLVQESDTSRLYDKILDAAGEIMGSDGASMQVVDEDRDILHMLAWRGFDPEFGRSFEFIGPEMRTSCSVARVTRSRVIVSDVDTCEFLVGTPLLEVHHKEGIRAVQSTPLIARSGKMLGMISTHWRQPHHPSEKDLRLLDLLARQAADLLDRSQAGQKLRDSEKRFRTLVELLPAGMYTCGRSGEITYFNGQAVQLWGREPDIRAGGERFCGSFRLIQSDGTDLPHDRSPMAATILEGLEFRNRELEMERPDGSRITVLVNIDPLRDAHGQVVGAINVFHDVTAIKRAEQQLKEDDRRKDEFLATLAHELRNPLAPIRNSLHILRMAGQSGPAAQRLYEMMDRQVAHLVRLVDDLLELSRISRGKIELKKEPVDLMMLLNHARETSRPLIEGGGHTLLIQLPDSPVVVEGDFVRLAQVFANLLNNSAKYTVKGGTITVSAVREGDQVVVSVRDTGIGIPRHMLSRVFDMFTQVDNPLKHTQDGLGIGLSLVRTLVTMHGGTVEARSEGRGHGSEFRVKLPVLRPDDQRERSAEAPHRGSDVGQRSRTKILVVDDNRDSADSLSTLLQFLGAEVRTVYEGHSALEALKISRPAVVLMDLGMPGLDGCEVARIIRRDPANQKIVLIALTGWGQADDRLRSRQAGFDHHLVKPVDLAALQALLESCGGDAQN